MIAVAGWRVRRVEGLPHMRKLFPSSLLATTLLSLAACNDPPPTPAAVRAKITTDVGYVVAQTNAATYGATLPSTAAISMLAGMSSSGSTSGLKALTALLPKPVVVTKKARLAADTSGQVDPQALIDYLNTKLFTDANSLGNGIFAVPAALACTETTVDDTGTETTSLDAACAAKFAQADVRIRVEENDDTLTFALQLDANHDEPITVSLSHDAVGLAFDLDNADHAMIALASIFAETPPNVRLAGAVSANLQILGAAHAKASFSIDRDVAVAAADQGQDLDGDKAFKLASAKAPVISLELDGNAHAGSADLGLGATTAQIPDDQGALALDLPGATAHASFGSGPLSITGIGLGDRTLTLSRHGQRAIGIDLNPADGRALDATIGSDGTVALSPKLDVQQSIDHAVLGDTPNPFDVTELVLVGSAAPNGDGLEVVTGSFSVLTNPASYGVVATAGQCVADTEVSDSSGQLYEQWMTATCN
jgi:hypothetical protein